MTDKITQFSETLTSVEFDCIIEIGKSLGIISYDRDRDYINWDDFPDKADGKIGPLVDKTGHFWYFIEFTDHSLSNDHIQSSIDDAREQAIRSKLSNNRKRLLIICQHDDDAVLVDRKINENFAHDSPEQSNNPHVYVIRWSDVVSAHEKKKICSCGNGKLRMQDCINNCCYDCCWKDCKTYGHRACSRRQISQDYHDDWVHKNADGWR